MAKILIVDDDSSLVRVMAHSLRMRGHTPLVALDGKAALREATSRPDLILLDLGLPELSGAEVLQKLKDDPDTAYIPVIIVSGERDAVALIGENGAKHVAAILQKPVVLHELGYVVDTVLWAWGCQTETREIGIPEDRGRLVHRLITRGSNELVNTVYLRMVADRADARGYTDITVPSWSEIARAGYQEGLLNDGEGALLG